RKRALPSFLLSLHLYMATFEEFFAKKKIDLQALRNAKPELYTEFHRHYHAMGEKSFDHTKKFWFNKLRKSYRLHEEEAPVQKIETAAPEQAVTTSSGTNKALGFKPKFRANVTKPIEPEKSEPTADTNPTVTAQENKPAGFKPRFKAGVTKTEDKAVEAPSPSESNEEAVSKPAGFKPRFKAGVTKTEDKVVEVPPSSASNEDTVQKPAGFKPRFKAGVTKSVIKEEPEATASDEQPEPDQASKPSGFKPRFKAGVTKTNKIDPDSSGQ